MAKLQLVLDTECYSNYYLVMFMAPTGQTKVFEMYDGHPLDVAGLRKYLENPNVEIVTFNGNGYDSLTLRLAMKPGTTNGQLKKLSDKIITTDEKPWNLEKQWGLPKLNWNHIDLIEVAPGEASLKIYGGRLHCPTMQDLPIEPDAKISEEQRDQLKQYCANDLWVTRALADALEEQINLRRAMSEQYGVDLRSKSDAQIAEAVLKASVYDATGIEPKRKSIDYTEFFYEPPSYVWFITDYMRERLAVIKNAKMVIGDKGHVTMPAEIENMEIKIGSMEYTVGIGGLHSKESRVSHYSDEHFQLYDRDVVSYYPNLMLNMGMVPEALGDSFTEVYRNILDVRVAAKQAGLKVKADSLKIVLNGTFGKTSNRYSILYNPKMMIATTLTGQLSLLMLIEALEHRGIPVVSANTDGVVIKCPVDKRSLMLKIVKLWEQVTNLETEETEYKSLHSRDVNNYVAIKTDGKVKTKGVYAPVGLQKSPQNEICAEAVVAYLTKGTPIHETVTGCKDIRKFLTLRTVDGGAVKPGYDLGKAIRWYYADDEEGTIKYKTSGNSVPLTEGAKPLMNLPDEFPEDVNHDWYISEAKDILRGMGAVVAPELPKLPRRNTKKWKELVDQGDIVCDHKGNWVWKASLV